ncbi:MAG: N-acetylmuramoyl-L-alanine amidase [Thermoleophilaceae bacterium]|nr:N-acetylmuramoyl-L-alanine amidase [Thermoleophilaceae bacterium]
MAIAPLKLLLTLPAVIALAIGVSTVANSEPTATGPLVGKIIALDPGHNGHNGRHPERINKLVEAGGFKKACDTTGTTTNDAKLTESAFNWKVVRLLREDLEKQGATVVLTRKSDRGVGPCINRRAAIGNKAEANLAISLHGDGGPASGHGFHVIRPGLVKGYTEPIVKPSKELAIQLRDDLVAAGFSPSTYLGNEGIDRRTDLGGLNLSKVPKVFIELGNMRNADDARSMQDAAWRHSVTAAIEQSIETYLSTH